MSIIIKRATRRVPLCVNADLYAAWQGAESALEDARKRSAEDPRETDTSVRDAAAEVRRLEGEMLAHTIYFTLQALRRKQWAEYVAAHPPREGDELDRQFGVDVSALDGAIVLMTTGVVGPDGEPIEGFSMAEDWEGLADEMASPQWEPFATAALALNQGEGSANVPFSRAASAAIRASALTSKRLSA